MPTSRPVPAAQSLLSLYWYADLESLVEFWGVYCEGCCFLVSSTPSGSFVLSAAVSAGFPECWGNIPFRALCSKVSHLRALGLSIFVPTCCSRKLLWWWLALTYESSKISLEVIFSLLFKKGLVLIGFTLDLWAVKSLVLVTQAGSISWSGS